MILELNTTDKTVIIKDESFKFEELKDVMFTIGIIKWKIIKEDKVKPINDPWKSINTNVFTSGKLFGSTNTISK